MVVGSTVARSEPRKPVSFYRVTVDGLRAEGETVGRLRGGNG
jgi:hypothetical protein